MQFVIVPYYTYLSLYWSFIQPCPRLQQVLWNHWVEVRSWNHQIEARRLWFLLQNVRGTFQHWLWESRNGYVSLHVKASKQFLGNVFSGANIVAGVVCIYA